MQRWAFARISLRLTDEEFFDVLAKQVKQRRESIDLFAKADRADLVEKEERELAVLVASLPAPLTDDELAAAVNDAVAELAASTMLAVG